MGSKNNENNFSFHEKTTIDQFTKQAIPFSKAPQHLDAIDLLIKLSGVSKNDSVLDVACGPGLVACEFARKARQVTGIDITPKMIEQARNRQKDLKLTNIMWNIGTVEPLPYKDNSFSCVLTRYSFHHFDHPEAVLDEMKRVCLPGGKILIADFAIPDEKVKAFNRMEKLRDPSHVRALSVKQFDKLIKETGLKNVEKVSYSITKELEAHLRNSFPLPGDDDRIRAIFKHDLDKDELGIHVKETNGKLLFTYPMAIYAGTV